MEARLGVHSVKLSGPIFYTANLETAATFYGKLGLKLIDRDGDRFARFSFPDGGELGIKAETGGREKPGSQTMMIATNDIQSSYAQAKKSSFDIVQELKNEEWGTTYILRDPDGNWVEFISS